ncbi:MAG: hypothetical protein IPI93_11410 [Sphingobacteriaceae bacterium]|nr:hypothetical protein [Sphingobacteriaceae bacterium]
MKRSLIIICICIAKILSAQSDSSAIAAPLIGIHFGGDLPFADMGVRYGANLNAGFNFMYKTKKNFLFGIDANYGFGRNIKEDVLKNVRNSDGFVVDNAGYPADIRISERVLTITLHAGKLMPLGSPNPNSGLLVDAGLGYMQHKVHFVDINQQIAAVDGDIKNGLDKLTNGICASQFVGYLFLSDNRFLNFYAGAEAFEGFTKSVRKLNYDTGLPDTKGRVDVLLGLRIGWILPLYSRTPKNYFYN